MASLVSFELVLSSIFDGSNLQVGCEISNEISCLFPSKVVKIENHSELESNEHRIVGLYHKLYEFKETKNLI